MNMQKSKIIVIIASILTIFVLYSTTPALAYNAIFVDPAIIKRGETTTITLVLEINGTGKLKVVYKVTGEYWFAKTDINIPPGGGSQSWVFPTDFEDDANTNGVGDYDVIATIELVPPGTFTVEFLVIPDLPFGTIMAIVACFGAVAGYTKLKRYSVRSK